MFVVIQPTWLPNPIKVIIIIIIITGTLSLSHTVVPNWLQTEVLYSHHGLSVSVFRQALSKWLERLQLRCWMN